ncbi:MAG: hypothetical protein N3F03_07695 [Ignavibacteria bacterium]|nr:hypothetical protein [Ignavibacteria bacterium]
MKKFRLRLTLSKVVFFFSLLAILQFFGLLEFLGITKLNSSLENFLNQDDTIRKLKIEKVTVPNPKLKWFGVSNAKKYQLVIKEYKNKNIPSKPVIIRTYELIDTFFVVPSLTLENDKLYSWNVKSFDGEKWSPFGEEFYFVVDFTSYLNYLSQKKLETISPGFYSSKIEQIKELNPTFKWNSFDDDASYTINIEKQVKKNRYKKISQIKTTFTTKDTFFVITQDLLKPNEVYRWNLSVTTPIGIKKTSDFRYFKIVLTKKAITPKIIYPGYKIEGHEIVGTKTPTFIWNEVDEVENYSVIINKKEKDGSYIKIFDSEEKFQIKDTFFVIPSNVLENDGQYKWNLRLKLKNGKTIYSDYLYFKVLFPEQQKLEITKPILISNEEIEELLLNMEYAGILKTFVSAIYSNDKIFISLIEFLKNLQIPFEVENKSKLKIIPNENAPSTILDFKSKKLIFDKMEQLISESDLFNYNDEYFLSIELIEKILSLNIDLDFSNLTIYVVSEKPLPIYSKYQLEQKYASLKKIESDRKLPLLFKRERSLLNGFILDYNISQSLTRNQRTSYFYNFSIGGEIFYGDFYYQRQETRFQNFRNRIENYNWKFTFNPNDYLTQISIGDDFVDGIESYAFRGLNITNEVIEPRKKIGNYIYQDKTEPNSLIELYLGNELVNITKSDEHGNFTFDIPLRYGMSNFEIRIHTIKGETKFQRKIFQVPYELLPSKIFNYRISTGLMKFTKYKFAYTDLKYGLTDYLTLSSGGEFIQENTKRHLNYFGKASLRILSNLFLSGFYSPKLFSKVQGLFIQPDYTSYTFEFINYKKNSFYNLANHKNSFRGNLHLPIKIKSGDFGFYFNHDYLSAETFKRINLNVNLYYFYNWFGVTFGVAGENLRSQVLVKRREANIGTTFNLNNLFYNIPILNRSFLSLRTNYDFLGKRIQNISLYSTSNLMNSLRLQINYEHLLKLKTSNFSLNLFLELPQSRYTLNSNASDVINHQLSGSIGYSPQANLFYLYREPLIGRSSLYIEGFEDKNGNSIKDNDENEIRGLDFSISSASFSDKMKNGKIFLGLNPYHEYTIKINEANLLSTNYSFEFTEFNIITDGNSTKIIRLPYYETGEIGGVVVRKIEKEEIPLSNVRLIVKNKLDGKEIFINTFSDGSFYFYGLRKGKYSIEIDRNYLQRIGLTTSPEKIEFEIDPSKNKLTIEDLKFTLK